MLCSGRAARFAGALLGSNGEASLGFKLAIVGVKAESPGVSVPGATLECVRLVPREPKTP